MASDASSTPPALTPDYTGSGSGDSSLSEVAVRRSRRPTAFYPNMNSSNKPVKPFSRSAAKRQSVMTLGSIEHLQHYFTKTGISAKEKLSKKLHNQLVPAIGGPSRLKASLGNAIEFDLPPSPAIPEIREPAFPPYVKTYETDPEAFLPGVVEDLTAVIHAWGIHSNAGDMNGNPTPNPNHLSASPASSPSTSTIDVLSILKTTTRAIRSVRNYVIALPDESAGTLRTQYRNKIAASSPPPKRNAASPKPQGDPLSLIRKSALEVLAALRELEERSRIPLSDEAYDAQSDHGSSQGQIPPSRGASPSAVSDNDPDLPHLDPDMSISFVHVQGRYGSVPVWEDENDYDSHNLSDEEREKREYWDDRLVLGGGWLYKQDVTLENLSNEQDVVRRYVDLVDDVLFGVKTGKRGWERERERAAKKTREGQGQNRRVSAGDVDVFRFPPETPRSGRRVISSSGILDSMRSMSLSEEPEAIETLSEGECVDEDDLPQWANHSLFVDDPIGRAYALVVALLPESLRLLMPSAPDRSALLRVLSSGQLLCVVYNTGVRRSRKPWGYISIDSIHDVVSLEQSAECEGGDEKGKTAWTFRRTDNLRLWAAALKLRYLLPLIVPSAPGRPDHIPPTASPARIHARAASHASSGPAPAPSATGDTLASSPAKVRFATSEPPLTFDPRHVARKEDGWEAMLEAVVLRWVTAVVQETRGEC
ncbi:hypothetical protein PAXRUDRAFT_825411 [Paxillus rubicundulus Ve08.2h10]|uniref:Uncharacterized protein n=1 Tax=Paxillus rubicundulus Ve08.2h10 TaxID=930991 RepID=A0A0D0E0M4_9AGAM|nr:hypothetical protein PAXRUDRAFT_825411 [Paxillus rubicundulus Ve08.2h10]